MAETSMKIHEFKKQTFIKEKLKQDVKEMTQIHTDLKTHVNKLKNRKPVRKSVSFADDCGLLLVHNFNVPRYYHKEPAKKLSKVTNVTEVNSSNDDLYLESTLTNRTAVFGCLVNKNSKINCNNLKIIYTWDSEKYLSTTPYILGGGDKSERLFFKIQAPSKNKHGVLKKDENGSITVEFFVVNNGEKSKLNNGKRFQVTWTGR